MRIVTPSHRPVRKVALVIAVALVAVVVLVRHHRTPQLLASLSYHGIGLVSATVFVLFGHDSIAGYKRAVKRGFAERAEASRLTTDDHNPTLIEFENQGLTGPDSTRNNLEDDEHRQHLSAGMASRTEDPGFNELVDLLEEEWGIESDYGSIEFTGSATDDEDPYASEGIEHEVNYMHGDNEEEWQDIYHPWDFQDEGIDVDYGSDDYVEDFYETEYPNVDSNFSDDDLQYDDDERPAGDGVDAEEWHRVYGDSWDRRLSTTEVTAEKPRNATDFRALNSVRSPLSAADLDNTQRNEPRRPLIYGLEKYFPSDDPNVLADIQLYSAPHWNFG